jgi:hypothetical protein
VGQVKAQIAVTTVGTGRLELLRSTWAVIVPCDDKLRITESFTTMVDCGPSSRHGWFPVKGVKAPDGFALGNRSPILLDETANPRVWLFNSAIPKRMTDAKRLDWLQSGLRALFAEITSRGYPAAHGRERRLIAMPLVGVGDGGFKEIRGATIREILATLATCAAQEGHPDIALVTWRRSDYAAVQKNRPKVEPPVDAASKRRVERLADLARAGQLVVFMGAGVSRSAGLPDWKELLEQLATSAQLTGDLKESLLDLPAEDAAQVIGQALTRRRLPERIVELLGEQTRYGLGHSILASMRLPEAVTTNYDTLYESACEGSHDGGVRVLPREGLRVGEESGKGASRPAWVLKLHGDVAKPETIVLTRSQYFAFHADSSPMASVVQAAMVTRHIMFVGYSVSDLNFIRLAYQVRALFERFQMPSETGTVITLAADPGQQALWKDTLSYVPVQGNNAEAGRNIEILLDCLAQESCDEAPYLLDTRYAGALDDDERVLAERLLELAGSVRGSGPAAMAVRRLLQELGNRP